MNNGVVYINIGDKHDRWITTAYDAQINEMDNLAQTTVTTDDYGLMKALVSRSWEAREVSVPDGYEYECTRSQSDANAAQHRLWQQIGESA